MAERSITGVWLMRGAYLGLALVIIFFHLIPLETVPRRWAPPDFLMAFTFAWVLRRPEYAPVLCIAVVMLTADLMFQRPPGLLAVLVVIGAEYLKNRAAHAREPNFLAEWANVALVVLAIGLINRLVLVLLLVPLPPLSLHLIQSLLTVAVYPLCVFLTRTVMGVRRPSTGDPDALGGRA